MNDSQHPAHAPTFDVFSLTINERIDLAVARTMKRDGISAGDIAERVGVHRNTLSAWRHTEERPRARHLEAIAEVTGYPLGWLEHGNRTGEANTEQWMASTRESVRLQLIDRMGFRPDQAEQIAQAIPTVAYSIAHANAVNELAECYGTNGRGTAIDRFATAAKD
jgi:transcriptional regulator with XRE-family HTH domain